MKIDIPYIYQGMCRHCVANVWIGEFKPKVERHGLRCSSCGKLNQYDWTEAEYEDTKKRYGQ